MPSRSPLKPLQPKPGVWIDASKTEKQPTQRPIVGHNVKMHKGVFTPPASTSRKRAGLASNLSSSHRKKPRPSQDATPTAPPIRSIRSFLTPPASTQKVSKSGGRSLRAPIDSQPAEPLSDSDITKWLSNPPQQEASEPPKSSQREPKPLKNTQRRPMSPKTSQRKSKSRTPSPRNVSADVKLRTPAGPPSSQRQLTQCPPSVLALHQRLCGQDDARKRATRSPWRETADEEDDVAALEERQADRQSRAEKLAQDKERKRLRLDVREEVKRQARERIEGARERRALGQFKSLVQLSSESSSSHRSSSSPSRGGGASKATALRPYSSAIEEPVCERDTQWPKSTALPSSKLAAMPMQRYESPFKPYLDRPRDSSPSPSKGMTPRRSESRHRGSASPVSPAVATPRKPKHRHLHITPPRSRTPQRNQPESLLVHPLPRPPAQPVFVPPPRPITEWRPVEMEAETLMTWSLGGGAASVERLTDLPPSDPPVPSSRRVPYSDSPASEPMPLNEDLLPSDPPLGNDNQDREINETASVSFIDLDFADFLR